MGELSIVKLALLVSETAGLPETERSCGRKSEEKEAWIGMEAAGAVEGGLVAVAIVGARPRREEVD